MQTIMDNVYIDYMDHLDFLWGLDVAKTVYKNILARMLQVVASSKTWSAITEKVFYSFLAVAFCAMCIFLPVGVSN